jgi:hypothetical protein
MKFEAIRAWHDVEHDLVDTLRHYSEYSIWLAISNLEMAHYCVSVFFFFIIVIYAIAGPHVSRVSLQRRV